jgi:hypothetical protein
MNTHQALGHMRALLNAQHSISQAQLKIRGTKDAAGAYVDFISAGKMLEAGAKEIATVKEGLSKENKGELSTAESMLRLLFDDLNAQKNKVELELLAEKKRVSTMLDLLESTKSK